jgi:putative component of toxin-antitoxin plasmid stabilization module
MSKLKDRKARTKMRKELKELAIKKLENDDNIGLDGVCLHIGSEHTIWFEDDSITFTYECGTLIIDEPTAKEIIKELKKSTKNEKVSYST